MGGVSSGKVEVRAVAATEVTTTVRDEVAFPKRPDQAERPLEPLETQVDRRPGDPKRMTQLPGQSPVTRW